VIFEARERENYGTKPAGKMSSCERKAELIRYLMADLAHYQRKPYQIGVGIFWFVIWGFFFGVLEGDAL